MSRSPQWHDPNNILDPTMFVLGSLKRLGYTTQLDSTNEYKDRYFQKYRVLLKDGSLRAELYFSYKNKVDLGKVTVRYIPDVGTSQFEQELAEMNVKIAKVGAHIECIPRELPESDEPLEQRVIRVVDVPTPVDEFVYQSDD
ncbi:MAG: hypothetical protein Q7R96_05420 [Nanoarchaeota archaeon]|nr:hypothetical protein [Nanoarchaeota archaeon]